MAVCSVRPQMIIVIVFSSICLGPGEGEGEGSIWRAYQTQSVCHLADHLLGSTLGTYSFSDILGLSLSH